MALPLFDGPTIETRRDALRAIEPAAATLRASVLAYVRQRGAQGATDAEIQTALGMSGDTERPRRQELERGGHIEASPRTRETASGRQAVVWVVRTFHFDGKAF